MEGFGPFPLAIWRSVVTVAVLIPIVAWVTRSGREGPPTAPRGSFGGRLLRLLILGSLGGAAFGIGMNVSVMISGATITAFIAGAYPVVAAAGAPLVLGERVRRPAVIGLILAFVGTLLIAGFDVAGLRLDGLLVGATTALVTGLFLLLSRRWQRPWGLRPTQITLSNFTLLGVAGVVLTLATAAPLAEASIPLHVWVALLWLGVFAGGVATILLNEGLRRLPASESSAYLMLNPLTAAILAVPVLGEMLEPMQLLGAALVLAGIGLATGTFALIRRYSTTVTRGS